MLLKLYSWGKTRINHVIEQYMEPWIKSQGCLELGNSLNVNGSQGPYKTRSKAGAHSKGIFQCELD